MFVAKCYDLGNEKEVIGYYPDALNSDSEGQIGSDKIKIEVPEEVKQEDNRKRSIRRTKSKVRRTVKKYKMRYMWTLTIAKPEVVINTKKGSFKYDTSTLEGAWKLWNIFIDRCRRAGLKFDYIVTIEVQEKRLAKYGEKVYHFHFATSEYIPQNEEMRKRKNMSRSLQDRYEFSLNQFWTFGFTKVTKPKKASLCHLYIMKYIGKNFEQNMKNKQRYRISEGLEIPVDFVKFLDHSEMIVWANGKGIKLDSHNKPLSKYILVGDKLEIFWLIIENT